MSSLCRSLVDSGNDGIVIDIECHLSNNLPIMVIVGFAGRAVNESKDRLRGAFASAGLTLPRKRITINLAPADIPKTDSSLDVAIAVSILVADEQVKTLAPTQAAIGECSLDGDIRPVRGIIGKLLAGRRNGLKQFYIPAANLTQAKLVPGIQLFPVHNLKELYDHLSGNCLVPGINTGDGSHGSPLLMRASPEVILDDVTGQAVAKRALVIAAAGGHNLLLGGPPGTGKSMLARALAALLPPLGHEEMLEVTQLHSLSSDGYEKLLKERPFRNPHHTATLSAMIGGGARLKPGEISLSHRGVLCLDEFPEFDRQILEALRQPLEDRCIQMSRARGTYLFPADFILVATANPCPCGFYGSVKADCVCSGAQLQRYRSKLSGPIIDRIDLWCHVHEVDHKGLLTVRDDTLTTTDTSVATAAVIAARVVQANRYGNSTTLNGSAPNQALQRSARLSPAANGLLQAAATKTGLSARSYLKVVKVGRTIADLAASETIETAHIIEALSYRQRSSGA